MRYHYFLFFPLIFASFYSYSQESIQGKIIDSTSQKPIPFATISINNTSGVISNDDGDFLIYLNKKLLETDSLFIRCLGYESKGFLIKSFQKKVVFLNAKTIELDEVLLTNKNYSAEEIIVKVKENLQTNYEMKPTESRLFYRTSNATNMLKNDVFIKESTIPEINQKFIDSLLKALPKYNQEHTEILADLYSKKTANYEAKLDIIKAAYLFDENTELDFEVYEDKIQTILRKHVKRDSYFKIKSGILGTKQAIDSSFFDTEKKEKPNETEAFLEEKKKQEQERKNNFLKYSKSTISKLEKNSFTNKDSDLNFLEKENRYHFTLEDYTFLNDDFVYKISFYPKRSEDYNGVLYINTTNFAIVRMDYQNTKDLKRFNLFGVSYKEYLKKGTLIYNKNSNNTYTLKFAEEETANNFGFKRPLTLIEKNKNTKGRRKQNEVTANLHFILANTSKKELVVFESEQISESAYSNYEEKPKVKPTKLSKYDPDFWKGYNIIEPNQAIRDFRSLE